MRASQLFPVSREFRLPGQEYFDRACPGAGIGMGENNFAVLANENPECPGHMHSDKQSNLTSQSEKLAAFPR